MNYKSTPPFQSKAKPLRTSELLLELVQSLTADRVSIGEIVAGLGDRGLGALIAIFALPNVLPSTVPFGNVATGIPPLLFAIQLTLGFDRLFVPRFIAKRTIGAATLKAVVPRIASVLSWFERLLAPRLSWVTGEYVERIFGVVAVVLAIVSTLPIPFAHNLPALGLVLIGMGLLERDGLAILSGTVIGLTGVILLVVLLLSLAQGLNFTLHGQWF